MAPHQQTKRKRDGTNDSGRPSPHKPNDHNFSRDRDDNNGRRYRKRNDRHDSHSRSTQPGTSLNAAVAAEKEGLSGSQNVASPAPSTSIGSSRPVSASSQIAPPSSVGTVLGFGTTNAPTNAPPFTVSANPITPASTTPTFAASVAKPAAEPETLEPVPFVPLDDSLRHFYMRLKGDVLQAWKNGSVDNIIAPLIEQVKAGDYRELTYWSKDIIWSVLSGRLQPIEAGEAIKKIIGLPPPDALDDLFAFEPHAHFTDTMNGIFEHDISRYRPHFLPFLKATGVRPKMLRELCDTQVLIKLGLIRDTFPKLSIRHATNQLYRQTNYNLLREETEGYSKLVTELFTTGNSSPPTGKMVRDTFERIKALIGTFDLDVGRVLDVTLDVFAAMLIKHFQFYVKLLRCSSWWPRAEKSCDNTFCGGLPKWALPSSEEWMASEADEAVFSAQRRKRDEKFWVRARQVHTHAFFELGGRHVVDEDSHSSTHNDADTAAEVDSHRRWIQETKTLPAPGNRTAAQLLGFKLRFYTCDSRDEDDILPANLLYLAALLIKIGFISLADLAAHLWPDETGMKKLHEEKLKELEEKELANRPGGVMNALAMAAALPDDTPTPPSLPSKVREKTAEDAKTPSVEDKPSLPDPSEQKVGLLISLLTIGAIPEALFLIGCYPWVLETHPEVLERIHRICHHSISEVYEMARPSVTVPATATTIACSMRDAVADDQGNAPKGFVKLERTYQRRPLRWPFPDTCDTKDNNSYRFYWSEWADNVPVCRTVDDVFTLCDTFLNISNINIGRDDSLVAKLARIGVWSLNVDPSESNFARWQDLLRRLLVPSLSITKANPSITNAVWELLRLYSIQDRYMIYSDWYDGPISRLPAIRAAFSRTRIETLGTMKRLSLDNLSQMAKALSKTSYSSPGIVFKVALDQIEAYANLIEAFVECAKYFTELAYDVLVWSLLSSLGGGSRSRHQESSVLLTSKWLQALSRFSGKVFRRFAIMNPLPVLQYVNHQLSLGNSTDLIILKELITTMGGIVPSLDFTDDQIVSMCGYETLRRQTLINGQDKRFDSAKSSKRLVQSLVDSQLAGGLAVNIARYRQNAIYNLSDSELHVKYISSLVDDSHQILIQYLDFLIYNLSREGYLSVTPSISLLMKKYKLDASLAFMVGRPGLSFSVTKPGSPETDGDVDMSDAPKKPSDPVNVVYETLKSLISDVETAKEPEFWSRITPEFFTTFWALQIGDIYVPEARYEKEYSRAVSQSKELAKDRSDMTHAGISKRAEKMKAFADLASQLSSEKKQHRLAFAKIKQSLIERVNSWFSGPITAPNGASDALIEQCLLPRLLLSPADADFSHRMVRFLHDNNAAGFRIMSLLDRLFNTNRLRSMLFICTVRESENLGRFLKSVLGDLASWHKDKAIYEAEALGVASGSTDRTLRGFASAFDEKGNPTAWIEHAQFKEHLWGWQKNIYNSLKASMANMEWLHIRNGITVLKCILDHFPAVDFMARQFANLLNVISDREAGSKGSEGHRVDLSVAAQTALSELQRRKAKWVMVQSFRANSPHTTEGNQDTAKPVAQNTAASEAKPEPLGDRRVAAAKPSGGVAQSNDAEDGEVRDLPERKVPAKQQPLPVFNKKLEPAPLPSSLPVRPPYPSAPPRSSVSSRGPAPNMIGSERFASAMNIKSRDNGRDQRSSRDSRDHAHNPRDDGRDGHDRHREPRDRDSRSTPNLEPGRLERPSTRDLPQLPERRVVTDTSSSRDKEQSSRRGRDRGNHSSRDEAQTASQSSTTNQRPSNNEPPINPARAAAIMSTQTQDPQQSQQQPQSQQQHGRGRGRPPRDEPNSDRKGHSPRQDRERGEVEARSNDRHSRDKEHRSGRESRNDSSRPERREKDADRAEVSHRDSKETPSRPDIAKDSDQQQDSRSQDRNYNRPPDNTSGNNPPPSGPRSRGRANGRNAVPVGGVPLAPVGGNGNGGAPANAMVLTPVSQRNDRFQTPNINDMNRPIRLDSIPTTGHGGRRGRGHGNSSLPIDPSGHHERHRQGLPSGPINAPIGANYGVHPDRLPQLVPPPPAGPPPSQRGPATPTNPSNRSGPDTKVDYSNSRNSEAYGTSTELMSSAPPPRSRPGGSQRQLDGINNTLQQAQNDRGRRQNIPNRDLLASESGTLGGSASDHVDNRERDRGRASGNDDHRGSRNDRDRRDKAHDRDRGSRRSGRDNSRDRRPRDRDPRDRSPEREREKDARDYRERDHGVRSGGPSAPQITGRDSREGRRGAGRDHGDRNRSDGGRQSGVNHIPISNSGSGGGGGGGGMSSQGSNAKVPLGPSGGVNAAPIGGDREKGRSRR